MEFKGKTLIWGLQGKFFFACGALRGTAGGCQPTPSGRTYAPPLRGRGRPNDDDYSVVPPMAIDWIFSDGQEGSPEIFEIFRFFQLIGIGRDFSRFSAEL